MLFLNSIYNKYIQVTDPTYNSYTFSNTYPDFIKFVVKKYYDIYIKPVGKEQEFYKKDDTIINASTKNYRVGSVHGGGSDRSLVLFFTKDKIKKQELNSICSDKFGWGYYISYNYKTCNVAAEVYSLKAFTDLFEDNRFDYSFTELEKCLEDGNWIDEYRAFTKKLIKQRSYQKVSSEKSKVERQKKRVVKFTYGDQKSIAIEIIKTIAGQNELMGYVLNLALDYWKPAFSKTYTPETVDLSGEKLLESLKVFSIDTKELLENLLNTNKEACKRFAVLLGDNEVVGLIDNDDKVRLAARLKLEKQKRDE